MPSYALRFRGVVIPLGSSGVSLGRGAHCEVVVDDPRASRVHARVSLRGESLEVVDLGSTNGTCVNGERLTGPRVLAAGDTIGIGAQILEAILDDGTFPLPIDGPVSGLRASLPRAPKIRTIEQEPEEITLSRQNTVDLIEALVRHTELTQRHDAMLVAIRRSIDGLVEQSSSGRTLSRADAARLCALVAQVASWSPAALRNWHDDVNRRLAG